MGPLEVRHDGIPVPVDAAKQRVLVATLALAANEPVPVERLIACLWDDRPPASARNTVQNYVLRLRRALTVAGEPHPLVTSAAGYRLAVDPDAVDALRFPVLVRSAQATATAGDVESASALLAEALGLWQGVPLADVPSELLHRDVLPGLVEQRLVAQEQRADLGLRQGRHQELATELRALTTENPLRERMWAQLMLALYRSGRTAAALDTYHRAGTVLANELGIDPGPELRRLHQAILTNDPDLTHPEPADEPVRPQPPRPTAPPAVVPRQLPAPPAHFVGRTSQLRQLDARIAARPDAPVMVVSAIGGGAGIGKTALAVHWAHQHADQFPDGQLYVNLRGYDPTGVPGSPAAAIHGFLVALGIPAERIPTDPAQQAVLYRSELADRRALVILDNARDAEQARPLLPGSPGCVVLVTSRDQLAGLVALDGAVPLTLDLLTRDEARDLLARRLGRDLVTRDQAVVDDLIESCARLPLALNIAAAHAALHPTRPLATLAAELRAARLETLTIGDTVADVRAVFSWSCRTLTASTARVFRLLGIQPGPDLGLPAAASLTGLGVDQTRAALDELTRAHLITERAPRRYGMHDLLRAYAADQAHTTDSAADRQDALRRVVDFYLHTAYAADRLLYSHRKSIGLDPPSSGTQAYPLADMPAAMAWFDAEHANLLAVQDAAVAQGWHATVGQLAWSLGTFHAWRGHWHDRLAVWLAALDAAAHLPDPGERIHAHQRLGHAYSDLGRHEEAVGQLRQALALAEAHHDLEQQAHTHRVLALVWEKVADYRRALGHSRQARELFHRLDQPRWEATTLNAVGYYSARLGDYDTAVTCTRLALSLHRQLNNPDGEAACLDTLGYVAHHKGDHRQAIDYCRQAVDMYRALGNNSQLADTLDALGAPYVALGEYEHARAIWREALELERQLGREQEIERVQRLLDSLDSR